MVRVVRVRPLMDAVRRGGVRMGNIPGSGVIDSPLWMGRLEGLAEATW